MSTVRNTESLTEKNFKVTVFISVLAFLFLLLIGSLIYHQIIRGKINAGLSNENSMKLKRVKAGRGLIFDRAGRVLVRNRPSYNIVAVPYRLKREIIEETSKRLSKIRNIKGEKVFGDYEAIHKKLKESLRNRFTDLLLLEDTDISVVSVIEEHNDLLPGIEIEIMSRREYPYGDLACHALGYLGEIPEKDFDSLRSTKNYRYGDLIGKFGLEKAYEDAFRGKDGSKYVEVNAYGREIRTLDDMPIEPKVNGSDMYTTLDLDIQLDAEKAFPDTMRGALVVLNPESGGVLAMLSSPRFNPNIFSYSTEKRSREWKKALSHKSKPMNNRAIAGLYEPGSTFKILSSIAGIETGAVKKETSFTPCYGYYRFGRRIQRCWKASGHGRFKLTDAIRQSCNVYFYQLGLETGIEPINQYARMFGFEKKTGIDISGEKKGDLLDSLSMYKRYGNREGWQWTRGLILNRAIGQGQTSTPLQLACYTAGVASGERIYVPHLMKELKSPGGETVRYSPDILSSLEISDTTEYLIKKGMDKVVQGPGGTAARARVRGVKVAGKTGSSENPHGDKTHSLFIGFAPIESPEIALAIVVENSGHGSSVAAPIAGKILREYFNRKEE